MIDHIGFGVQDYERSKAFYTEVLAPLGYGLVMEATEEQNNGVRACGFGPEGKPAFWLSAEGKTTPRSHIAFVAPTRSAVEAFYARARELGAQDNGAPGVRAHYHPTYYAAFILDLDGHNAEAVCHGAES